MYNRDTQDNVLEFSRGLEKKYANEKQFFRTLPLRGHVGLPTDKMAMSLVPEDLPYLSLLSGCADTSLQS